MTSKFLCSSLNFHNLTLLSFFFWIMSLSLRKWTFLNWRWHQDQMERSTNDINYRMKERETLAKVLSVIEWKIDDCIFIVALHYSIMWRKVSLALYYIFIRIMMMYSGTHTYTWRMTLFVRKKSNYSWNREFNVQRGGRSTCLFPSVFRKLIFN
jgi:hypothetical protein